MSPSPFSLEAGATSANKRGGFSTSGKFGEEDDAMMLLSGAFT